MRSAVGIAAIGVLVLVACAPAEESGPLEAPIEDQASDPAFPTGSDTGTETAARPEPVSTDGACPAGDVPGHGFSDVADGAAHETAIGCVVWWRVARGVAADRYSPSGIVSRGQMASFLADLVWQSAGRLPGRPPDAFTDDDRSIHETAVNALAAVEVVSGTSPGRYRPDAAVTRGQLASFLVRTHRHRTGEELTSSADHFRDDDGTTHEGDINAAAEAGLVAGREDGTYGPNDPVSRAQMATFLARGLEILVRADRVSPPDAILAGAGDIGVCGRGVDEQTAALLDHVPGTVATFGDNAYDRGTAREFANCYDPSWGRHKDRTRPSIGNHEVLTDRGGPYYDYFGAAAGTRGEGWYSYDLGDHWHVVVLNSNCGLVDCQAGSPQERWLRSDLAANSDRHVLAYWHAPRFSTGAHGSDTAVGPLWDALYEAGAELVLTGHEHSYERFARLGKDGQPDPAGIRQIIVGTGGTWLRSFPREPMEGTQIRSANAQGVIVVTLRRDGYTWHFVPTEPGAFTDRGSTATR
ncbi:MAG: S-layer homology domain-containing protein [Nitriliruptorales bacterium]